jgi:hypothetical protein
MSQSESSSNNFNSLDRTDNNPNADLNVPADIIDIQDDFVNNIDINNNYVYFDYPVHYDSDQESYVDDDDDDDNDSTDEIINSDDDDNDRYDDLENLILDQLEFEHNNKVLFGNYQAYPNEYATNDDDNDREGH